MTLVVAYCDGKNIACVADTALTQNGESFNSKPWMGTLKIIAIDKRRFIAFAGVVTALDLIREIWQLMQLIEISTENIIEGLLIGTEGMREKPDFIVGEVSETKARLYKVANGNVEPDLQNVWIGSDTAFAGYQPFFHEHKQRIKNAAPKDTEMSVIFSAMGHAMNDVIDHRPDETVGGFATTLAGMPNQGFAYGNESYINKMVLPKKDLTTVLLEKASLEETITLLIADRSQGGWAYTISRPSQLGIAAVGIFILHLDLTIVFCPMIAPNQCILDSQLNARLWVKENLHFELEGITFG
jgi:hypothetical protein